MNLKGLGYLLDVFSMILFRFVTAFYRIGTVEVGEGYGLLHDHLGFRLLDLE
jgi:hypothetical protein